MADNDSYFTYLSQRSRLGLFYRTRVLYPRIAPYLLGRTLDVGCGIGDMLRFHPGTIGVDINPMNIAYCRQDGLDAVVMAPDVLPFEPQAFDSVVLDNVLEHIANPAPLLAEVHRVLRPGGVFVVGVPGQRGYASDDDHKVFYNERMLIQCVTATGFIAVKCLHTPLRSTLLDRKMRQYCLYGVFTAA